jgi:hypothetical protein
LTVSTWLDYIKGLLVPTAISFLVFLNGWNGFRIRRHWFGVYIVCWFISSFGYQSIKCIYKALFTLASYVF